ncbi:MAG: peptide ABC transporter substrate-binding protein [Lachnospiraceae bacterium]|nr:peptide ABC transporter substrate-binding protein [Lachnospiraceae bacterium]
MAKKILAMLLAATMIFGLAACGGKKDAEESEAATESAVESGEESGEESGDQTDTEPAPPVAADEINVCLSSEPATLDPALNSAVDGATVISHLFSGLAKWEKADDGALELVADCAEELVEPEVNEDGTVTYTYTLKDGLKWSDGKDLTAYDFEYAWKRAVDPNTGADYAYMFEVVKGYDGENPDLAVEAVDEKTLKVTLNNECAYWNELLAFPTYFPVREDVVGDEAWATDPSTYVSNGAYKMTGWEHNSLITIEKNEDYYDADSITMNKINFYLSDDANNMLANFENGDWQMIDDVPTNEIASLKEKYPDEFIVTGQLGTYYVIWNINEDILPADSGLTGADAENARAEIRNAINIMFDRNYIVEEIGQSGQVPASSFVAMGLTDADGKTEFYQNAGHNDGYIGYYDVSADAYEANWDAAIEVLKKYYEWDDAEKKFTNFPTMTYLYNTSEGHKAIGEYLQSALAGVGITMNLENQEWATFLETRKQGDYSIARNGWLGDYNDPISFLDMWVTISGNNDAQFGRDAHKDAAVYSIDLTDLGFDVKVENGTWAETYDVIISLVKTCTDKDKRFELMHRAEDLLMSTGAICPLYYYTDTYMIDSSVKGFFSSPLGYKFFKYCTYE